MRSAHIDICRTADGWTEADLERRRARIADRAPLRRRAWCAGHLSRGWRALLALAAGLALAAPAVAQDGFTRYGEAVSIALPLAAAGIALVQDDGSGAVQLAGSAAATLVVTQGLKRIIDAERPDGGQRSFPSSRTAAAFAGAAFLHQRYGWEWGLPAYAAATAVGASRVAAERHHWADVVAGAGLAIGSAYLLVDPIHPNVEIFPWSSDGHAGYGVTARLRF